MNPETASLLSLGEYDEELQKKIVADVERIVAAYLTRNMHEISNNVIAYQQNTIERLALRGLKHHLNNAGNIY